MIKTKGVLHLTIPVSDPARSRAFYTDILGLEFVAQVPQHDPHFVFLKSGPDYVVLGREESSERFSDIIHHAFMVDGDAFEHNITTMGAAWPGARLRRSPGLLPAAAASDSPSPLPATGHTHPWRD